MIELNGSFENISQRAICSYIRQVAELILVVPEGLTPQQEQAMEASERDLHAFFQAFYQRMFDAPAEFGLPTTPDDCITGEEKNGTEKKAEMNRKLEKPRDMIRAGIEFLMLAGQKGRLAEDGCISGRSLALDLSEYSGFVQKSKNKKQFFKGFPGAGLEMTESGETLTLTCPRFPAMFLALKTLAEACAQSPDPRLARYNFGRCDFRALDPHFHLSALDLFRVFNLPDYERAARLDAYFSERGYKPIFQIYENFGWEVQYQGKRSAKGSPLLRIEYSERFKIPLRVNIKCASSDRLLPLLPQQPRFLQEDFSRRVFNCGGDSCGWCKSRKNLGPSVYEFDGVQRTICWFSNQDMAELNDDTEQLIHQYAEMHEALG
jgi:hypothetical protein